MRESPYFTNATPHISASYDRVDYDDVAETHSTILSRCVLHPSLSRLTFFFLIVVSIIAHSFALAFGNLYFVIFSLCDDEHDVS